MITKYSFDKIEIELMKYAVASWTMGKRPVRGREHVYDVIDRNFPRQNRWQFVVRVPYDRCRDRSVQVQPLGDPPQLAWAGLEWRSIAFLPADKDPHQGKVYCKIFLQDPKGKKTKVGTHKGQRDLFPRWMAPLRHRMRLKSTVKKTKGSDGESQVILLQPDDHRRMIFVFFATKIWVQKDGVVIQD